MVHFLFALLMIHRADSHRRQISPENMEDAVIDCLDAAKYELEIIEYQIKLLRACKYGKLFIKDQETFDCDQFVETCRFLRVLNNIRNVNIGMPLTYTQFEILTPEIVVQRLINRKKHLLAIKISKYLNLNYCVNQALEHWSICKIESAERNISDGILVEIIRNKITKFSSDFSYAKIARCAQKRSVDLAKLLLDYEPRSKIQINSLIEFEQYIVALKKSLISLDIDLINQTLIELISKYYDNKTWHKLYGIIYENNMKNNRSTQSEDDTDSPYNTIMNNILIQTFIDLLMNEDESNDQYKQLLKKFLTTNNEEFLQYQQQNMHLLARNNLKKTLTLLKTGNIGLGDVEDDGVEDDSRRMNDYLESSTRNYEKLRNKFNVQMCADLKRLIIYQKKFDKKILISGGDDDTKTLGLSVNDTVAIMLEMGEEKEAEKLKKELFIPEKRWWFILIDVYIRQKQFDKLCQFIDKNSSQRRPPPMGYLPIIESFLEIDQKEYAKKYILKLSDIDEKLEWLCQLSFWMDAVDVAVDDKDFDALQTIKYNCNDAKVKQRIDDLLNNLK